MLGFRREKKLVKKTLKKIEEKKRDESLLSNPPGQTYKRQIVHTEMPWPLQIVLMGRKDVLFLILLIIGIICSVGGYVIYQIIMKILERI
jgi:hypothetical protein